MSSWEVQCLTGALYSLISFRIDRGDCSNYMESRTHYRHWSLCELAMHNWFLIENDRDPALGTLRMYFAAFEPSPQGLSKLFGWLQTINKLRIPRIQASFSCFSWIDLGWPEAHVLWWQFVVLFECKIWDNFSIKVAGSDVK